MPKRKQHKLRRLAVPPVSSRYCHKATLILNCAHESASALLEAFEFMRGTRGHPRGMTTDAEQDLLRAMLVMAAAGVDAMVKQIIRDSLPALVTIDPSVKEGLEKFVARQIRAKTDSVKPVSGTEFLSRILAAPSQQTQVIEEYIRELTGGSLQSAEELFRTVTALGLDTKTLGVNKKTLKSIFDIRNEIIHELDINLDAERRIRNLRSRPGMMSHTNTLVKLAENIRNAVDKKLAKPIAPLPQPKLPPSI